jgi:hypothetical protein
MITGLPLIALVVALILGVPIAFALAGAGILGIWLITGNLTLGSDALTSTLGTITIKPTPTGNTGTVVIQGNLDVKGTTTTVESTVVTIADINITLASGATNAAQANGGGITIAGANATLIYNSTSNAWVFDRALTVTGNANAGNVGATSGVFTLVQGTLTTPGAD